MQSNLHSLQSTIKDLKEIIEASHADNGELPLLVKQLESIVSDMEAKMRNTNILPSAQAMVPFPAMAPGATII